MYSHKTLIPHVDNYLEQLNNLIQDETKKSFSEKHKKESRLINNYKNLLQKNNDDFRLTTAHITEGLNLEEHPEGGFYREFIRTNDETVIFYLLPNQAVSRWHCLENIQEEFKLILGKSLIIPKINSEGKWKFEEKLEKDKNIIIEKNESGYGDWFGAYTDQEFTLVTCTCRGPFEFPKFKVASDEDIVQFHNQNLDQVQQITDVINKLSPTMKHREHCENNAKSKSPR